MTVFLLFLCVAAQYRHITDYYNVWQNASNSTYFVWISHWLLMSKLCFLNKAVWFVFGWFMDQTHWLIDENQRAPLIQGSQLRFLPGDNRKQPGRKALRLLGADRYPPGIAMETDEVDLHQGSVSRFTICIVWFFR